MVKEYIDQSGTKHFDDQTIDGNEGFLRRIEESYWHKDDDRLSSSAFGPEDISFCLESLISPAEFHNFFPDQGLFKLLAEELRDEGEVLEKNPYGKLKWENAHALSWGKRTKTKKKKLSKKAEILYTIPNA